MLRRIFRKDLLSKLGVDMAQDSILLTKSLHFAARIVKLHRYLLKEKHETVISKQIIRSATSISANANEAIYGISKADFVSKLHISLKETAETEYWLHLLVLSEYISEKEGNFLLSDCLEIKRILISTLNTAKELQKQSQKCTAFGKYRHQLCVFCGVFYKDFYAVS